MRHIHLYDIAWGPEPRQGEHPNTVDIAERFHAVLNVSDTPNEFPPCCAVSNFWYPINEVGYWGFGPFFWSKRLLDKLVENHRSTYIHCHAGAHRSPMIVFTWLLSRGHSPCESMVLMGEPRDKAVESDLYGLKGPGTFYKMYLMDVEKGCIPKQLKDFHAAMNADKAFSLMGILQSMGHPDTYAPEFKRIVKSLT